MPPRRLTGSGMRHGSSTRCRTAPTRAHAGRLERFTCGGTTRSAQHATALRPRARALRARASEFQPPGRDGGNAQAVEILVRVRRVDELQALTAFHGYLLSVHRSQASRGVLPGHASACQEIADLVRRYPKHETVTRTWECAK